MQYTLDLLQPPPPTLENFIPGANAGALAAVAAMRAGAGPGFLHLWGEAGCGRSHLLLALAAASPPGPAPGPAFDLVGRPLYDAAREVPHGSEVIHG